MGRKHSFTETELFTLTKELVLQHGYDGFTLKLLSSHLPGARSTIYQYFPNKEELVSACMARVISDVLTKTREIDETVPETAIKELLNVYLDESHLHQLIGDASKILVKSETVAAHLKFIDEAHLLLKDQLTRIFEQAQEEGVLRRDIPLPVLAGTFFNLINTPNMLHYPAEQWSDLLFTMWMGGSGPI
ncbi:MAG TPA: TetR/AcrR family transcriptional regulator [Exiguobacterium sp.]|uniref:TetR/AcrR family transcriptional regulator n=1 Tax=Exiguobacterium sp. TaxID=44751 RepID=UPI000EBB38E2|nr:TetR/AcrR family transcriptional regulator [Exiguobacterium sp.]HCN59263.1 TetR/AcrR family transcriptional regulator [Exiguobacterium sp.]